MISRKFFIPFSIFFLLTQSLYSQLPKNKIISIAGYFGGKIPLTAIKKSKQLEVLPSYSFVSCVVYFANSSGTACTSTQTLKANMFDGSMSLYWKRLGIGSIITLDNIKVSKPNGEVGYLVSTSFEIVAD